MSAKSTPEPLLKERVLQICTENHMSERDIWEYMCAIFKLKLSHNQFSHDIALPAAHTRFMDDLSIKETKAPQLYDRLRTQFTEP